MPELSVYSVFRTYLRHASVYDSFKKLLSLTVKQGMVKDVPVQDVSSRKQIASPFKFSACKPEYRHVGVELVKQTDIVLKELGYTLEQIKKLKNAGVCADNKNK